MRFALIVFCILNLSTFAFASDQDNENLVSAVSRGDCIAVVNLLKNGASPEALFMSYKPKMKVPVIFMSSSRADECVTKALVDWGANIDPIIKYRIWSSLKTTETPLLVAIRSSNVKALDLLIKLGANPNVTDERGTNLLAEALEKVEITTVNLEAKGKESSLKARKKLESMKLLLHKWL